ncbi:multidrug effflux MFS transporter [Tropicimonas sp. IMCC34011]|uniref:multidrug effflux MFS transporter n=1 Tax=Tropicimonas sp. IMCC34011 TaxID=2248759 RepID=UPI001E618048|nr:multidrug effflux MFS transporter [Tropicimonas sp. IMCC34011]
MPRRLAVPEFVVMLAMLFACVAFSIDAMLPALPQIAEDLTPDAPNKAQLVLTAFVFGMGIGTLFSGPLSDTFGRKTVITFGIGVFIAGAIGSWQAENLETMLAFRALQGLGASAPRIVALAMVRDLYEGRRMAQITSFMMMIFILIPAMAPSAGELVMNAFGWRSIFLAFALFGLLGCTWLNIRQDETLPLDRRRSLRLGGLWTAVKEVLTNKLVLIYIAVLTLGFGQMFAFLSSIQQIYAEIFGITDSFPQWFLVQGLIAGTGTIINATLVMRLGMRRLAIAAYGAQTAISTLLVLLELSGLLPEALFFPAFFFWATSVFFMAGLTFGNLNALALEPMGHIAGLASSVVGCVSTIGAVILAAPIGLAFNGTIVPLSVGVLICSAVALVLMMKSRKLDPVRKRQVSGHATAQH